MDWLWTNWHDVGVACARALLAFGMVLIFSRLVGLRSYAKMSSTDFITTLAIGSVTAAIVMNLTTSLVAGAVALGTLYAAQWASAWLERFDSVERVINNQPMLLMVGDEMIDEHLRRVNCTPTDVYGKLREANVTSRDQILAVVFETTGDISVLHGDRDSFRYEPMLFDGIHGHERIRERFGSRAS